MRYIDYENLPVEIKNNELPIDEHKNYEMNYDEKIRTSGGFIDAIFLAGVMITCFMFGMLAILAR